MKNQNRYLLSLSVLAAVAIGLAGCTEPKQPAPATSTAKVKPATADAPHQATPPATSDTATPATVAPSNNAASAEPSSDAPDGNRPAAATTPEDDVAAPGAPTSDTPFTDTATAAGDEGAKESGKVLLGSDELFAGIPGEGELTVEQIKVYLDDAQNHEVLQYELPLGLSAGAGQEKGLKENPLTRAKIELGRQLYFDGRLSKDGSISCASCHAPETGFATHTQFGVGVGGLTGGRNSPASYNRIFSDAQFWDGRAPSLEEQAKGPIANPIEMVSSHDACVSCLKGIEGYRLQFAKVFANGEQPGEINIDTVAQAIAAFERAIVTGPSPFDYYEELQKFSKLDPEDIAEDETLKAKYELAKAGAAAHPMSASAQRGHAIYFSNKGNCSACHVGPNLTDEKYHNIGVGMDKEMPDLGRFVVTGDPKDKGAFKTPTIRNVAQTPPYMHDGSMKTLEEVVEFYNKGGHPNEHLSDKIKKLDLTQQEQQDLVEFMKACTGDLPKMNPGRLPSA